MEVEAGLAYLIKCLRDEPSTKALLVALHLASDLSSRRAKSYLKVSELFCTRRKSFLCRRNCHISVSLYMYEHTLCLGWTPGSQKLALKSKVAQDLESSITQKVRGSIPSVPECDSDSQTAPYERTL